MTAEEELETAILESRKLRAHYTSLLTSADEVPEEFARYVELRRTLEESVAMQSLYARLVNSADGGRRQGFADADAWIARLRETGKLPVKTP